MSSQNETPIDALRRAIALEDRGMAFYSRASKEVVNPKGKEILVRLARDESRHREILMRQIESLRQGKGWVKEEGVEPPESVPAAPIFPSDKEEIKKAIESESTDLDISLFAIRIEHESFIFYRDLARTTEDPTGKEIYRYLASFEKSHFDLLMTNYEYLTTTIS